MLGYDIDIKELIQTAVRRRRLIMGTIAGCLALAVGYLHVATYLYTATMVVSPVMTDSSSGGGMMNKLGGLKGLASLAGVNIGGDLGSQSFVLFQEGLYSRDVAGTLAKDPRIMHVVFDTRWDEKAHQWRRPSSFHVATVGFVKGVIGMPVTPWQPPDAASLQKYVSDNVTVDADPTQPVVTITYRDKDPTFAGYFLARLYQAVDSKLRAQALDRATQYSKYLTDQLKTVMNQDVRTAMMSSLIGQETNKMMASVTAPYSAQPFDPPFVSPRPTFPKPALVLFLAGVLGLVFGVLGALWLPPIEVSFGDVKRVFGRPSLDSGR